MTRPCLIELKAAAAVCRSTAKAERGSARRLLVGHHGIGKLATPDIDPTVAPGRVISLGRFRDADLSNALADALPPDLRSSLRDEFEWYGCRGAFFHNDAHYSEVLFGVWSVGGPARDLVFSRGGIRVPLRLGTWVVFDPFEPHGVLRADAGRYERDDYLGTAASLMVGFELVLDAAVRSVFGICEPRADAPMLASGFAVNPETGALP